MVGGSNPPSPVGYLLFFTDVAYLDYMNFFKEKNKKYPVAHQEVNN